MENILMHHVESIFPYKNSWPFVTDISYEVRKNRTILRMVLNKFNANKNVTPTFINANTIIIFG